VHRWRGKRARVVLMFLAVCALHLNGKAHTGQAVEVGRTPGGELGVGVRAGWKLPASGHVEVADGGWDIALRRTK
jgi:hypothetical protein